MPELRITIGERPFTVACQEGEEHFLQAAAGMLDQEAMALKDQIGRLPESRMLLMAGLMLADKTAGVEDRMRDLEDKIAQQEAWIEELQAREPEAGQTVEKVPSDVMARLADLAARAEAIAERAEEKARAD